ncbi:MAG: V-type ATP synthase subunit D [Clostridia bacterium]|nr:V-type ATP synthase subunit D [Clostridia bacterium]MBR3144585.1 V-type ATP synthase subunit D [Clostridia bacterium]
MAILNVNATRMELTNLKRKLNTARRGHKLLKDKRDELMRRFLDTVKENLALRLKVEEGIKSANNYMAIAGSVMQPQVLSTALMLPKQEVRIDVSEKNVMSVMIPEFKTEFKSKNSEDIYSYGYAFTSGELDGAVSAISSVFTDMIKLAEIEKSCQLMADEIEKTRRRVNALEHVMIPRYEETIRYISMKLDENERSTTTRLMKIKDMMIAENVKEK